MARGATCSPTRTRRPSVARELDATVCWMSERPLEPRARLAVKHTSRVGARGRRTSSSRWSTCTRSRTPAPERLELNDLARGTLRLSEPLAVDPYPENRATGAFVLVDEATNETVGAGMVVSAT